MVDDTRNACLLVHEMTCETDAFFNFFFFLVIKEIFFPIENADAIENCEEAEIS